MNITKNPFSLYDFLGYFIPGAFMLITILVATTPDYSLIDYISHMGNPEISLKGTSHSRTQVTKWEVSIDNNRHRFREEKTALEHSRESAEAHPSANDNPLDKREPETNTLTVLTFAILAYLIGHFLSYISAITVEFFSIRAFRYPSAYLLARPDKPITKNEWMLPDLLKICKERLLRADNKKRRSLLLLAYILCSPVTFPMTIFVYFEYTRKYFTKSIDANLIRAINRKVIKCKRYIDYQVPSKSEQLEEKDRDNDSHLLIMHFVTVHISAGLRKADNYVALYGFLRSMSLALSVLFILATISAIIHINSLSWGAVLTLALLAIAPSISYLGYLKFYRRHTLENLMSFLVFPLSSLKNPTAACPENNDE